MANKIITAIAAVGFMYVAYRAFQVYHTKKKYAMQKRMHDILTSEKFKVKGRYE